MKKTLIRITAMLFSFMLITSSVALAEPFPIVNEPITVKVWAAFTEMQTDWEEMYVWDAYAAKTGINIDWQMINWTVIDEQMILLLASGGDMPDAFYKCYAEKDVVSKYGNEGAFLALNDYIDQYMPNYKACLDKYGLWNCYKDLDTGNIYSIGMIDVALADRINCKLFLNKTWMENCGIEKMPTTLNEFTDVLRAFRDQDANGNGDPTDEVPITSTNIWNFILPFMGAFGLSNRGAAHHFINWNEETQDIEFMPVSENWRALFSYVNMLYEEGLIDPGIFNQQTTAILALSTENRLGGIGFINADAYITTEYIADFASLGEALEGPYGKTVSNLGAEYNDYVATAFMLSEDCRYPVEMCKWIDYFYSEEGSEFIFWGEEGKTFNYNEDGTRSWSDWVMNNEGATSYDLLYSRVTPWSGGAVPCIALDNTMSSGEVRGEGYVAAINLAPYVIDEIWPPFNYTQEEIERNAELWANLIANHYDPSFIAFVKGELNVNDDAVWNAYVEKYNDYGVEEWMNIYRTAMARYLGK